MANFIKYLQIIHISSFSGNIRMLFLYYMMAFCKKGIDGPTGTGAERGWANGNVEKAVVAGYNSGHSFDAEYYSMEEPGFL